MKLFYEILWHTHDLSLRPKNLHTNMANRIFNCMLVKQIFNLWLYVANLSGTHTLTFEAQKYFHTFQL